MGPKYFKETEAALYTGLSTKTLAGWRAQGKGPKFYKLGSSRKAAIRYAVEDLDAFMADFQILTIDQPTLTGRS